jgi:hypothetical protein
MLLLHKLEANTRTAKPRHSSGADGPSALGLPFDVILDIQTMDLIEITYSCYF